VSTPAAVVPRADESVRGRIRVLVVDDSLDHRTLMARRLAMSGMQVSEAGSAVEALSRCDEVDLVLLDYRLPDRDGLDVLTTIRQRPRPPSVILVTAAGSVEVAVAAMRAGAVNFVPKDRGYIEALPAIVERAWQHHDLARRAEELQRAALLLTATTDQDRLAREVAGAARRLLRARTCVLLLASPGQDLQAAAVAGPRPVDLAAAIALGVEGADGDDAPFVVEGRLMVPLPREGGEPVGTLALWVEEPELTPEEERLTRAFAAFASSALRHVRRFELERQLVTELQQTLDARQDFVASISHELRTPLTSIAGFTATLRTRGEQLEPAQRDDLLERVSRNAVELASLVDELLELAAIERGGGLEPAVERVDLAVAVGDVVIELEPLTRGWQVRADVDPVAVLADPNLVRRTVVNLLSNAVKFSEPGSHIDVRTSYEDAHVRVEVIDEGIGLPPWEASHVFDPFFRARSSVQNAIRGSGIGLALVARYVRAMGGEVAVRSSAGEGSTFSFTLPLADHERGRAANASWRESTTRSPSSSQTSPSSSR
jgi:signal transduction histidine kinase